ncbi:hypothetical protein M728_005483 (plasmid) [Ensifer sp. WSM1721]|uniref:hypothetical protein n=1 Tax=Ensifer sp. WSM1721 TaxID=1041159 RepID=UPI00047E69FA|nr:hypothetical protein [Ensifer sp. WSM1721]
MFLKADGTKVWLRSSSRLPYLALGGVIESSENYEIIRSRLMQFHELTSGIASDDAFLMQEFEDKGALVFCMRPDKNCALLLLGKFDYGLEKQKSEVEKKRKHDAVLANLFGVFKKSADSIARQAGPIRFDYVQTELAMTAG